jgi:hypothetical protein
LTPPSLRSVAPDNIDVLGFHSADAVDRERLIIDNLIEQLRASTYELIRLNHEASKSKEKASRGVLWPRYECRTTHGDGVPLGRAFDYLIRRCEDVKK